jgi:hypothetical protein
MKSSGEEVGDDDSQSGDREPSNDCLSDADHRELLY